MRLLRRQHRWSMDLKRKDSRLRQKIKVRFDTLSDPVLVTKGTTILEAASLGHVRVEGSCGGRGICGECKVIATGELSPLSAAEKELLSAEERRSGYRLACQAEICGDVEVEVPDKGELKSQILTHAVESNAVLDADVKKYYLSLPQPTLGDQRADLQRIHDQLPGGNTTRTELDVLRKIPGLLRESDFQITAVVAGGELIDVEAGNTVRDKYGIGFDIGTTTVVGYLMDLNTGEQIGVSADLNPQSTYGADVISRLSFVMEHQDGTERLQEEVVSILNELIEETCSEAGVDPRQIYQVTVVGNTCMHHLFFGIDPRNIAPAPFVPVVSAPLSLKAKDLGLNVHPHALVHALPNVAGYVGADIVGGILATGLYQSKELKLFVDIGTNGEIVLGNRDRLLACAAAAGPAFEGARISCGMRAASGAIDRVSFNGDVRYTTVDGNRPRGLCGSGLLDLVAEMLRVGAIEPSGRIVEPEAIGSLATDQIKRRVVEGENGPRFVLAQAEESAHGQPVYLTQRDVRELQLAKGAIFTGIQLLKKELGVEDKDLAEVLLAGAFGNYLRRESALRIGLLPPVAPEEVRSVGNAAGEGAKIALISTRLREMAREIAQKIEYIELSGREDFMQAFADNMFFPEMRRD
ncbi:MAG: ferredoxin [Candidatus Latescibacterota bacterium]|nr:MAG: ferredoxin [Candidatus Latescibacterota bacterium]RKY71959.1 MAG: ferredoxin [Candidatus Latescibacterota bacterium]